MSFSIRHPSLADVPLILDITRASDLAAIGEPDWTTEEIVETLTATNHDPSRDSWLAADDSGETVAWAYLDNPHRTTRDNIEIYVVPDRGEGAFGPLLDLAVTRVAERARDSGHPEVTLWAGAIATEQAYLDALRAAGFHFRRRHARMRRELTGQETEPCRPDLDIRPVNFDDEAELRRFHQVLESAFGDLTDYQATAFEDWRAAIDAQPSVSRDEWFVALVDGQIVGALQSSDQAVEHDEGWIKNLAVLREYRKSGIGAALLATAFACYARKGRRFAGLGVDLTNPTGAYRLYAGVGMTPTFEADVYERVVKAPQR
jgi:mycothiol synthase